MPLREYLILALLSLALFLPGLTRIPPLDRDEPRFAEASRQMLATGDFVDIRFQDEARLKKPIGIYWLQSASAALLTTPKDNRIWPYRLPSTIGAVIAVLLTAAIGARLHGRGAAWIAGAMMAASLLLGVEARLAKTDAVLLATVCAAQLALARIYLARGGEPTASRRDALLFWAALGLGVLVKGPIILMVTGLTAGAVSLWDRQTRWLRELKAWPYLMIALLIVAPWGVAIMLRTHGAFLSEAVGHDLLAKMAGAQEAHGAPPGFFLVTFWATFWPCSFLAGLSLPWIWRNRARPSLRFCLCWLVPSWIVFELVPTKLPHYTLPLFPAIALMTAQAVVETPLRRASEDTPLFRRLVAAAWLVFTGVLCFGLPLLPRLLDHRFDLLATMLGAMAFALFGIALFIYRSARQGLALGVLLAGCLVFYGDAYARVMPQLGSIWLSSRVAHAVESQKLCPHSIVTSTGYSEPSLVFLLGPDTRFGEPKDAADALLHDPCALALVDKPSLPAFTDQLTRAGRTPQALAEIGGINAARGKRVDLTLFRLKAGS
ncbi:MAG TPA: glycosyltransferase family 39 protein [Alphaproteobacteria bacterium]|nr:glycosyltransferase family 39 protein [Alphaproteobacteria bacterium]